MRWRPRTLNGKLKLTVVSTTMLALLLSLVGTVLGQVGIAREELLREMEMLAEILGANGGAALVFLQPDDAERILSSLASKPHVIAGDFLTSDGELFASYARADRPQVPLVGPMEHAFSGGNLVLRRDVVRDGETIGEVVLISSLDPLYRRLRDSALFSLVVFVSCASLALWVAYRWLGVISRPIQELVATADQISRTHDYTLRAQKYEDDELGRLTDGFNQMLDQVIEQQRLERDNLELVKMQEKLEAQNAELERFTYTVSHDLKSPLFTIQGFLGLLEQDLVEGGGKSAPIDNIEYIRGAAEKMEQLLDELLELSRIGRVVNPIEEVDLGSLIQEVLALVQGELLKNQAKVEVEAELPKVRGDLPRLREVFQNLIINAARYTKPGAPPIIQIGAEQREHDVLCVVRDNGIGIDPAFHDKIFGLFESLHAESGGSGIGLAVVKRIVEHHGGQIWVESQIGHGAAFFFTLASPSLEATN